MTAGEKVHIPVTRRFEGTVDSASPAFQGLHAPAKLALTDRGTDYECEFVFDVGIPIPFRLLVPKNAQNRIEGSAKDPRGWDVAFTARLDGNHVTGTFNQPHDHGTFELREV
jgi:hypothetical protein